MTTICQTGG
jgi:hypothetical protein